MQICSGKQTILVTLKFAGILPYVVSGPIHSKLWQFYRVDEYFDIQNKNNRLQGYCKFAKNTRNIIADLMGTPGVEL